MDATLWVLVGALLWLVTLPLWVFVVFRSKAERLPAVERASGREILPEEWRFVYNRYCLPGCCLRLEGDRQAQPRDAYCEVCASRFMERAWRRAAAPKRELPLQPLGIALAVGAFFLAVAAALVERFDLLLLGSTVMVAGAILAAGNAAGRGAGTSLHTHSRRDP